MRHLVRSQREEVPANRPLPGMALWKWEDAHPTQRGQRGHPGFLEVAVASFRSESRVTLLLQTQEGIEGLVEVKRETLLSSLENLGSKLCLSLDNHRHRMVPETSRKILLRSRTSSIKWPDPVNRKQPVLLS